MNEFFFSALSFGLASGLKPGPLGIVVIQQTLSRGLPCGVRASLAPLVTDGPIIIAALWLLSQFKSIDLFAAALSLVGGLYLLWLSLKMFRVQNISISSKLGSSSSLGTAVKVNLLNPGPYLFWFTVGGSYIVRGTTTESIVFVVTAIGTLIASKIAVALLAANFLPSLESRGYLATMKVLAALLAIFGLLSLCTAYHLGCGQCTRFLTCRVLSVPPDVPQEADAVVVREGVKTPRAERAAMDADGRLRTSMDGSGRSEPAIA